MGMERVLQARIIFCAVEMLRRLSVGQCPDWESGGTTGLHFAIFEDGGSKSFLDIADTVEIVSRYARVKELGDG